MDAVGSGADLTLTAKDAGTPFTSSVSAINRIEVVGGTDDSLEAKIAHTIANTSAADSFSSLLALDTLTEFSIGSDKIDIFYLR